MGIASAPVPANRSIPPQTTFGSFGNTYKGGHCEGYGINTTGQVVGGAFDLATAFHAFRTASNRPINPSTDDLGPVGYFSVAHAVSDSGQVVGRFNDVAFRTAPNSTVNPATDNLGTLGGTSWSDAFGINNFGQVIGWASLPGDTFLHAFRTAPNSAINPATDDLGTLGGNGSVAYAINAFGQVVGYASLSGDTVFHAFRTAPNRAINPATDDLGTLGGSSSQATGINNFGQVVGWSSIPGDTGQHPFLYSAGAMHDLIDLVPPGTGCELTLGPVGTVYVGTPDINDAGQIVVNGNCGSSTHALLLTPIYKAFVQEPIDSDGSSVFSGKRGVVPVKFRLIQYDQPSCTLLPATITIVKAGSTTLASVDESVYSTTADNGSNFRIDPTACLYIYNLAASQLGPGTYRVDINISGIMVGHAVFALK